MIERKLVENFRILYEENNDRLKEWDKKLLDVSDPLDWINLIADHSVIIREIFAENEELLEELWEHIPEELGDNEAELLYDLVIGMYDDSFHDFVVLTRIGERLIPYFEEIGDYECLLSLYHMLGDEYAIFYRSTPTDTGVSEAMKYFEKVAALKEHYDEIDSSEARYHIFTDYRAMLSFLDVRWSKQCAKKIRLYSEIRKFYESDIFRAKDGDKEVFASIMLSMDEDILDTVRFRENLTDDMKERLEGIIEQMYQRFQGVELIENDRRRFRISMTLYWLKGELTEEDLVKNLIRHLVNFPAPIYSPNDEGTAFSSLTDMLSLAESIIWHLENLNFSDSKKNAYIRQFFPKVMDIMTNIPYSFRTEAVRVLCADWYKTAEQYFKTEPEKIDFLMKMIVQRQPITYIHSLMVAKIAQKLANAVINSHPGELVGVRGCKTPEEVVSKRDDLTEYINACGLIHDVGKCNVSEAVNNQNRKLSESEFDHIRKHPELGLSIIKKTPVLEPYFDIILGHHKTYDGKHGYPLSFDNTVSPLHFVIDLLSIADSTDAATDILGRNYATGKDFDHLLEELKSGAGTRYNPMIVNMIENDEDLKADLALLTSDGRYEIYFQAYQEIAMQKAE